MSFMKKHKLKVILLPVAAILLALILAVNILASMFRDDITIFVQNVVPNPIGVNLTEGKVLAQQIAAEGMVLLRNDDIIVDGVTMPALPIPIEDENRMPFDPLADVPEMEIIEEWNRTNISVFGWGATDYGVILGGSGSGAATAYLHREDLTTIRDGLSNNGFQYHVPTMEMMEDFVPGGRNNSPLHSMVEAYPFYNGFWNLYEPSAAQYRALISGANGARAHSGTALIVLTRRGGEGGDLLHRQFRWNGTGSTTSQGNFTNDTTRTYLDITPEEDAMIGEVLAANFDRVIVMLNVANAMNMSFLDQDINGNPRTGIHAAFVMGFAGAAGMHAMSGMLTGYRSVRTRARMRNSAGEPMMGADGIMYQSYFDADGDEHNVYTITQEPFSPSGRTVNTWISDFAADPTFVNSSMPGSRRWTGTAGPGPGRTGERFVEYMEGIFMGYWYYETARIESSVATSTTGVTAYTGFDYDEVVIFPLGFGLSFTEFSWEIESVTHYHRIAPAMRLEEQDTNVLATNSVISIDVRVTNIGNRPGQDVVQAYFNAPYTAGGIEKPYIRLAATAKTDVLQVRNLELPEQNNHYQVVTLQFDLYHMASYDFLDRNNNGFAGFEFDPGYHFVRLQSNARWMAHEDGSSVTFIPSTGDYTIDDTAIIPFYVEEVVEDGNTFGLRYNEDIVVRTYSYILNPQYDPTDDADDAEPRLIRATDADGNYLFQEITRQFARNRFTGSTAFAGAPLDGSATGTPQNRYMTRNNFGAFIRELTPNRAAPALARVGTGSTGTGFIEYAFQLPANHTRAPQGQDGNLRMFHPDPYGTTDAPDVRFPNHDLLMRLGSNFNHPDWQLLLNQIPATGSRPTGSLQDMPLRGGFGTGAVHAVGKPQLQDLDGPSGINMNMLGQGSADEIRGLVTAFPVSIVLSQTWNADLAEQFGFVVATEARGIGASGWYAPGANIHRSPFGGRNFEYHSESAMLTGLINAYTIKGSNAGGLRTYIKHWAINETDQNRYMLNTFLTEQAAREIYLFSFQLAVQVGGANAMMSSFNRVGTVWAGSNGALNIGVLRNEWGFRGSIVTDFAQGTMNGSAGIRGGNDIWLTGAGMSLNTPTINMSTDMDFYVARRAAHNVLFTLANTYYLSQISELETPEQAPPPALPFAWWIIWGILPINLLLFAGLFACIYFAFKVEIKGLWAKIRGKNKGDANASGQEYSETPNMDTPAYATAGDSGDIASAETPIDIPQE